MDGVELRMRDAISHRGNRPAPLDETLVAYDPTTAIDDFLDAGGSFMHEPVRAFPTAWTNEAVDHVRFFYAKFAYMTELKAAEMGVSRTYERHQYAPSWNAPLFPEVVILAATSAGIGLKRAGETKKKKRARAGQGARSQAQTAGAAQEQRERVSGAA